MRERLSRRTSSLRHEYEHEYDNRNQPGLDKIRLDKRIYEEINAGKRRGNGGIAEGVRK